MVDPSDMDSTTVTSSASTTSPEASTSQPTEASSLPEACAQCEKTPESAPLKQCLKCHSVSYCSKDCQKAHFKSHKKVCASLAQEYAKAHEPKMASRAPARAGARDRGLQKWQVSDRLVLVSSCGARLMIISLILECQELV